MILDLSGSTLDIVLIIILILSIFNGYKNGLVDSLARFILTLIVFFLSWFFSEPLALFVTLPEMTIEAEMLVFIEPFLCRAVAFIGLLIGLSIAKSLLYMLVKPIIHGIMDFISIVGFANRILGVAFNVAKNVLIVNALLAILALPVISNGQTILEESKMSQIVMSVSPSITDRIVEVGNDVVDFVNVDAWANRHFESKDMIRLFGSMNEADVLNSQNLNDFYVNYNYQINQIPSSTVSSSEYQELLGMIDGLPENEELKNVLRNKIVCE